MIKGSGGGGSLESLDFFGHKEEPSLGSDKKGWGLAGAEEGKGGEQRENGVGTNHGEMAGKRKRAAENSEGKRKKKKKRGIYVFIRVPGRIPCLSVYFLLVSVSFQSVSTVSHFTRRKEASGFFDWLVSELVK